MWMESYTTNVICLDDRIGNPPPSNCAGVLEEMPKEFLHKVYTLHPVMDDYHVELPEMFLDRKPHPLSIMKLWLG